MAVKVLKSDLAEDADFRRRFRDESQAVAMLSHPNIVSVYDVSRGETEYIVMELIDGITLKQYMEKRGQLNLSLIHIWTQTSRSTRRITTLPSGRTVCWRRSSAGPGAVSGRGAPLSRPITPKMRSFSLPPGRTMRPFTKMSCACALCGAIRPLPTFSR